MERDKKPRRKLDIPESGLRDDHAGYIARVLRTAHEEEMDIEAREHIYQCGVCRGRLDRGLAMIVEANLLPKKILKSILTQQGLTKYLDK